MVKSVDAEFARNEYYDRELKLPAVKLLPGEYHVTGKNMVEVTVLGSCVSACIRDPELGIGGMNHFMLPEGDASSRHGVSSRYGVFAMEILINTVLKSGGRRTRLEAKVFGGGNVMRSLTRSTVGQRNAEFVLKFLNTEKIPVVAQDLVDVYPRKVYHFPHSGLVRVKKLIQFHNDTILERERSYRERIDRPDSGGEIELFG